MTNQNNHFFTQLNSCPVIAILRGLAPENAEKVGATLFEAGIRIIEVPLNSPRPLDSISTLRASLPQEAIIGAGTVTTVEDVRRVAAVGGNIVVSPNTDTNVIRETLKQGMISGPGCLTPSEAFSALQSGAHALKIFPASVIGASGMKAMAATLPEQTTTIAVGGVGPSNMDEYASAGTSGFGLGSSLFTPGISLNELRERAENSVAAAKAAIGA